jgi:phosphatidylserine/phosphatidylglycerophosphate/cardiolipin synthase-like enzyme
MPAKVVVGQPQPPPGSVLISAVYAHGRQGALDEAVRLTNVGDEPLTLDAGWSLAAPFGVNTRVLRFTGQTVPPRGSIWIAHDAEAFANQFGFSATVAFEALDGGAITFANGGGWVALRHADQVTPIDALVYGSVAPQPGWIGPPLQHYVVTGTISAEGQVLLRRDDPASGLPSIDTDAADDWINHRGPSLNQSRPVYAGWLRDWRHFATPIGGSGAITVAIAPDAGYTLVAETLTLARDSIDLASFTFDQPALGLLLARRVRDGVRVRVLLDGAPIGGLSDPTRWICQQLAEAASSTPTTTARDSGCRFMLSNPSTKIAARYRFLHAKYAVVDRERALIGSENFSINGLPDDDKADGTLGHRGVVALIAEPEAVARIADIFEADLNGRDITPWCSVGCPIGPPLTGAGFTPMTVTGGVSYTARYTAPLIVAATVAMTVSTSPESHLADADSLLALLSQAGMNDEIWVEQLDEPWRWGGAGDTRESRPNPRVEALIMAAQRGAQVTVVLDGEYDRASHALSNASTVALLRAQQLPNLRAVVANPTQHGIHNKMVLLRLGQRRFAHLGSWNGSEVSAKLNREMSLLVESDQAYDYLRQVALSDFQTAQPMYFPIIARADPAARNDHLLISEIMVNPVGNDLDGEWIEIYNPTPFAIDLSTYRIGDAVARNPAGTEGMYRFPQSATIAPGGVVVVAQSALTFAKSYGRAPDFELGGYDPDVPDLQSDITWAPGGINLGNDGDEVALLQRDDTIVDVVTWLAGSATNTTPFGGSISAGSTLQRWPPSSDTGNCAVDFKSQAVPSVGRVP